MTIQPVILCAIAFDLLISLSNPLLPSFPFAPKEVLHSFRASLGTEEKAGIYNFLPLVSRKRNIG